jgi:hypothetical protein
MVTTEEEPLPRIRSIRHRWAGRDVRPTVRRVVAAGTDRIAEVVGAFCDQMVGRATRPPALVPVRVQAGSLPPLHEPAPDGCSSVWVASPSATRLRQG